MPIEPPKIILNTKEHEEERINHIKKELEELRAQLLETKDTPLNTRRTLQFHAPIDFIKTYPGLERVHSKEKMESLKTSIRNNGVLAKPTCTLDLAKSSGSINALIPVAEETTSKKSSDCINAFIPVQETSTNLNAFKSLGSSDTPVIYCILGNGRITALKEDGHEFVDVELKYVTADEAFQMSLDENDEREDLNPLDRALQFKNWIESTGISQTRIAELRNKTQPWVSANLRLLNLPLEIQTHIRNGAISMNQANKILRLKNDSDQLYIANLCIEKQSEKYIDEQVSLRLSEMDEALKALEPEEPNTETKPITIVIPNTEAGILKPEPSYSLPVSPSSKGYDHMSKTDLEIELDRQQREKEALKKPYHAWKYLDERQDQHCKEMDTCANCFNKEPAKWKVCKTKNKLSKETFAPNVKADFLDE